MWVVVDYAPARIAAVLAQKTVPDSDGRSSLNVFQLQLELTISVCAFKSYRVHKPVVIGYML